MNTYNKLVRDRVPQIIESNGSKPNYRTLTDEEYKKALKDKLQEEVLEFLKDDNIEELADILTVVVALAATKGCSFLKLIEAYEFKKNKRGGFEKKIFLESVEK